MKVKELRELLENCNDDDLIVMSKDAEGNTFTLLSDIDSDSYVYDSQGWWGDVYLRELSDDDLCNGYTEEDLGPGENCIILWPTN